MIKDVTNVEPACENNRADDIRTAFVSLARMTYLGFSECEEFSDDDILKLFVEALGEDIGKAMYEFGADEKSNTEVDMVFTTVAENSDFYHTLIDSVSE